MRIYKKADREDSHNEQNRQRYGLFLFTRGCPSSTHMGDSCGVFPSRDRNTNLLAEIWVRAFIVDNREEAAARIFLNRKARPLHIREISVV